MINDFNEDDKLALQTEVAELVALNNHYGVYGNTELSENYQERAANLVRISNLV